MSNVKFFVNGLNEMVNKMNLSLFKNIGELENLKLYDVCYYCHDNDIEENLFNLFCEDSYNMHFLEMLEQENLQWLQIGRTSSHYFDIDDLPLFHLYYQEDYNHKTNKQKAFMVLDELLNSLYNIELEFNGDEITNVHNCDIETIENDYTQEELKEIIKELKESVIYTVTTINKGYKWLDEFKKHQIDNFKEWLKYNEEC